MSDERSLVNIPDLHAYFSQFPGDDSKLREEIIALLDPESAQYIAWNVYMDRLSADGHKEKQLQNVKRLLPNYLSFLEKLRAVRRK